MSKFYYNTIIVFGILLFPMTYANENDDAANNLREMIFNLDPSEIGFDKNNFNHSVWGMVMETGFENGSFSLVTLADGTTSLYFSTGGGTIGAGEHESVRKAVGNYLSGAQYFYKNASKVEEYPRPFQGEVIFYFFTFEGKFAYSAPEEKLGNEKDELSSLFYAAHEVISAIREIEEK